MTTAWRKMDQLLTCSLCTDRFRNPKLLPCQHTFCTEPCLERLVANHQLKCPECNAEHRVPFQGVQAFPNNVTLVRFLELRRDLNGRDPEPPPCMQRCSTCKEKEKLVMCRHCDRKVCAECKKAHIGILRQEIALINNQVKEGLKNLANVASQAEKNTEKLQKNYNQVKDEIEEVVRRYTRDLHDTEEKLQHELDVYLQNELKAMNKLQEDLQVEVNNVNSNCELVDKYLSNGVDWTDTELVDYKEIFLRSVEFLRAFDFDSSDCGRRVKCHLRADPEVLHKTLIDFGEVKTNAAPVVPSVNVCPPMNSALMRSQSDNRLAAQLQRQQQQQESNRGHQDSISRSYRNESDAPTPYRRARDRMTREKESCERELPPTGSRFQNEDGNHLSIWRRDGEQDGSSFRGRMTSRDFNTTDDNGTSNYDAPDPSQRILRCDASSQQRDRVMDTEDATKGPLSGVIRILDSPHVMERLHQSEIKQKKQQEEQERRAREPPPPPVPTFTRPVTRQISEDEIEKQKKQNQAAAAAATNTTTPSALSNSVTTPDPPVRNRSVTEDSSLYSSRNRTKEDSSTFSSRNRSTTEDSNLYSSRNRNTSEDSNLYSSRNRNTSEDSNLYSSRNRNTSEDSNLYSSRNRNTSEDSNLYSSRNRNTSEDSNLYSTRNRSATEDTNLYSPRNRSITEDSHKTTSRGREEVSSAKYSRTQQEDPTDVAPPHRLRSWRTSTSPSSGTADGERPLSPESTRLRDSQRPPVSPRQRETLPPTRLGRPPIGKPSSLDQDDPPKREELSTRRSSLLGRTTSSLDKKEENKPYSRVLARRRQEMEKGDEDDSSDSSDSDSSSDKDTSRGDICPAVNTLLARSAQARRQSATTTASRLIRDSTKDDDKKSSKNWRDSVKKDENHSSSRDGYLVPRRRVTTDSNDDNTPSPYSRLLAERRRSLAALSSNRGNSRDGSPEENSHRNDSSYNSSALRRSRIARSKSSHEIAQVDDSADEDIPPHIRSRLERVRSRRSREKSPEEQPSTTNSWSQYLRNKYGGRSTTSPSSGRPVTRSRTSAALVVRSDSENSSDDDAPVSSGRRYDYSSSHSPRGFSMPRRTYMQKGKSTLKIGKRGTEPSCFTWPRGVAVSQDSLIAVADSSNHRIQVFNMNGKFLNEFGTYGSNEGEMDCPAAVTVNRIGQFIVSDRYNHRILVYDPSGRFIRAFGAEGRVDGRFSYPWGIATDNLGFIYVCDKENHRIQVFQGDGTFVTKFGTVGQRPGELEHPHYIAVSTTNRVIVSDSNNHRVQIFDVNGRLLSTFGTEGSDEGQFKFPRGVAVDDQGYVIVGDSGNNRIQVFHPDGTFLKAFGCWGAGDGEFKGLEGIAVYGNSILVCDRENHRIQVF